MVSRKHLVEAARGDKDLDILITGVKLVNVLTGNTKTINSINFSPDGKYVIAAGSDQLIRRWKVADFSLDTGFLLSSLLEPLHTAQDKRSMGKDCLLLLVSLTDMYITSQVWSLLPDGQK